MEGFSTYKTLQTIASIAASDYNRSRSTTPEDYAQKVIQKYRSDDAPEKIKKNQYYRYLLDRYSSTVINEVVRIIENISH